MTIGFVGVGAMGSPMARHLMDAGYELVVCDVAPVEGLAPARVVDSPRAVGDAAEVVLVCVPDASALRSVVVGVDGLVHSSRARVVVHAGTSGPEVLEELVEAAPALTLVDAPVTGGVPRARRGTLTSIISGPRDVVAEVRPLVETYSERVVDLGLRPGDAQRAKLVNNILSAANLALASEAVVLGRKMGLDPWALLEVINSGSGQNSATLTKIPDNVLPRQFNRGGRIGMLLKDLDAAGTQARVAEVPMPLAEAVRATFARAIEADGPDGDSTSVVLHMERAAGLDPGVEAGDGAAR